MGDRRRFNEMAELILKQFPRARYKVVLDIAGGKGFLSFYLAKKGYLCKVIDIVKNRNKAFKGSKSHNVEMIKGSFTEEMKIKGDLIVGLHPDEATEAIIEWAVKNKKPFIVCPCCLFTGSGEQFHFDEWIKHLERIAEQTHIVDQQRLKIKGKNLVLIGRLKR